MSFKDWLHRVGKKVSNFFENVWNKVTDWWEDGVDWVSENVPQVIEVSEKLKRFFKGPVDNMVFSKWLGLENYGNAERIILKGLTRLIHSLEEVNDINECLADNETDAAKIDCLITILKSHVKKGEESKWAFWFAKHTLLEIYKEKGVDASEQKVENIVQGFYDARTIDK